MLVILQGLGAPQQLITQGYSPSLAVTRYVGAVLQMGPTTVQFVVDGATGSLGETPSFAVAAGDTLAFDLLVELD